MEHFSGYCGRSSHPPAPPDLNIVGLHVRRVRRTGWVPKRKSYDVDAPSSMLKLGVQGGAPVTLIILGRRRCQRKRSIILSFNRMDPEPDL